MGLSLKIKILNLFRKVFQLRPLEWGLARLTRGRLPGHIFSKFVPNPYQYKRPALRQITMEGVRLSVDISDYIGHYYFFGFKDPAQENLFSLCKDHFNVLDIGSNIGFTLLKFAQKARGGRVIGFEPDPVNFSACSHNLSLNKFDNATVLNLGLGYTNAELDLEQRSPGNRGGHRISPAGAMGIKVNVKKLDDIFPGFHINSLELIKIDVEGYELRVLQGSEQTLRRFKPVLFIEVDNDNLVHQGDTAEKLIAFLATLGYRNIVDAQSCRPLAPDFDFTHCHFDIIAR